MTVSNAELTHIQPASGADSAQQILQELRDFGYDDAKTIYIRDFNVNDPEIRAYVVTRSGQSDFQGCSFNPKQP